MSGTIFLLIRLKVLIKQHLRENKHNSYVNSMILQVCIKKMKLIEWSTHEMSGGAWLQFAIGHLTQSRVGEKSMLGRILILAFFFFFRNRSLKIDLGRTAPLKMTAMTI